MILLELRVNCVASVLFGRRLYDPSNAMDGGLGGVYSKSREEDELDIDQLIKEMAWHTVGFQHGVGSMFADQQQYWVLYNIAKGYVKWEELTYCNWSTNKYPAIWWHTMVQIALGISSNISSTLADLL